MKANWKIWMSVIVAAFMITACSEPGVGGKKEITGQVMYNGSVAEGATVYIIYDATEAGENYDDATITDANGEFSFAGLEKGDYFVDAEYTDEHGIEFNSPGYHVVINNQKDETIEVDFNLD